MSERLDLRIGIDVGGTNTDAVVLDRTARLVAKQKVPTTPDVMGGIVESLARVVAAEGVDPRRVTHVMLGTTHATNAVLERTRLCRVAVIRIGGPATHSIRPLFGWPADLRAAVSVAETILPGGSELDGRDIAPFDPAAVGRFLESLPETPHGVAITSVFASVSNEHELAARDIVRDVLGDVDVSMSHEIGSVGLLERENATVLNVALAEVARMVSTSFADALRSHGLTPAAFFAQNDGTLMTLDHAVRFPVLTIGSGPANSIRGAAYLSGRETAIVVDVGGTSTDVGMLTGGFPRESALAVGIGGVRTNFRMPDIVTIAIGGGTRVSGSPDDVRVGPESVGFRIGEEALVFGGSQPTLTDAAAAAGRVSLGEPRGLELQRDLLRAALATADVRIADAIDRIKTTRGEQPVIVVGGGSVLVPDRIPGASEVQRPEHFEVANAIGAAIGLVSGEVDRVVDLSSNGRAGTFESLREEATDRAIRAGADPSSVEIVDLEEIPLAYLSGDAVRVRVRAAGPLDWRRGDIGGEDG